MANHVNVETDPAPVRVGGRGDDDRIIFADVAVHVGETVAMATAAQTGIVWGGPEPGRTYCGSILLPPIPVWAELPADLTPEQRLTAARLVMGGASAAAAADARAAVVQTTVASATNVTDAIIVARRR